MSKKVICLAMLGTLWSFGSAWGQSSAYEKVPAGASPATHGAMDRPETGLSSWIVGNRDGCCFGQVGADTPIGTELFVRIGPSFPVGGEFLGRLLETGWMIEGGGRAMFFNKMMDRAWFIEASLSNTHNHSGPVVPISAANPVAVQFYNRTFVNLGLGHVWYLFPATETQRNLRFGFDGGGRYGSASMGLYNAKHITDVVGGSYAAIHSDVVIPFCSCGNPCIFQAGIRVEYGYTWSDILSRVGDRSSDLQDINFLFSFGVRY